MKSSVLLASVSVVSLVSSAGAAVVAITNSGFESNGVATNGFLNAAPTGWTRITPTNTTVGVIGETRGSVMLTPDGVAWAHIQTDETNPANSPRLGQNIGSVSASVFTGPEDQLEVEFLVGKRTNGNTNVTLSVFLYAGTGADWTTATLIDSAVYQTTLAGLGVNDIAAGSVVLELDNTAAQLAGGNYWLVFGNTATNFAVTGGNFADSAAQMQLDRIVVNTIPEPSAAMLLASLGAMTLVRRRRPDA